jgi:DNA replication protein DnaC
MDFLSNVELASIEAEHPELKGGGCPTCRGQGKYTWNGMPHNCDCREQRRLYTRYARAGIGLAYMRMGWADVTVPNEQLAPVYAYLDKLDGYVAAGMGLFLSGAVGSGKTMVANLLLKEMVKRGYDCYGTTFVGAIDNLTASWRDNGEKRRFAQRFELSKVLALDDVGKEFSTKLANHTLDRVLRIRDQEARPTIITTNLTSAQVSNGFGGAVLSLLVGRSIEVPLKGDDFRVEGRTRTVVEVEQGETRPIR